MTPEAERYRDQLRAMLPELAERYGVSELGLFGSRVRGDHRPDSDLDVLVNFRPDARVSLFTLVELGDLLADRLGVKVDLAIKDSLKPYIGRRILAEVQYL
jgi:predicted nucleotidyltransferase